MHVRLYLCKDTRYDACVRMDEHIRHIQESLKAEGLSEQERLVLRRRLEFFMHEHPLRVPFHVRLSEYFTAQSPHAIWRPQVVALALTLVLFTGVGTSYAAESALPGDGLYFVKVSINEPVLGAMAFSDSEKADWHVALAERRLDEAEALAAEGRLNEKESGTIAALLHDTTRSFDKRVSDLALSDVVGAAEAKLELDTSLDAHEQVLLALAHKLPDVQEALQPVVRALESRKKIPAPAVASVARVQEFKQGQKREQQENGSAKEQVEIRKKRASAGLESVRALVQEVREEVSTSTLQYAEDVASTTDNSILRGHQDEHNGRYDNALEAYADAIRSAKQVQIQLKTDIRIQKSGRDQKERRSDTEQESQRGRENDEYPHERDEN